MTSFPGNYEAYLLQKLEAEANATAAEHKRQRWIAQEVAWLRRGVEARRTKSKARIQRARSLMAQKAWAAPQVAQFQMAAAPRLGHTVVELEHVAKRFDGEPILSDVSFLLQRGERVGIVGPNGVGKTTFLRVLLGELAPDAGSVTIGKSTVPAYYDQQRLTLDPLKTVYQARFARGLPRRARASELTIGVPAHRHRCAIISEDLLFPIAMPAPASRDPLRGRAAIVCSWQSLFLAGANLLVLDEPTNDLDLVTLNVLERLLLGFQGSVLLVTHDRYFLDKVATAILAFEGQGKVNSLPGQLLRDLSIAQASPGSGAAAQTWHPSGGTPIALTPATGRRTKKADLQGTARARWNGSSAPGGRGRACDPRRRRLWPIVQRHVQQAVKQIRVREYKAELGKVERRCRDRNALRSLARAPEPGGGLDHAGPSRVARVLRKLALGGRLSTL